MLFALSLQQSTNHFAQAQYPNTCVHALHNPIKKSPFQMSHANKWSVCVSRPLYILLQQRQVWNHFSKPRTCISSRTGSSRKQDIRARTYNAYFLLKCVLTHWDIRRIVNYNIALFHIFMKYFNQDTCQDTVLQTGRWRVRDPMWWITRFT